MAFLADSILDDGVQYAVTNGSRIDICSSEPTTYTAATSTNTLGNKTGLTVTGPANASSGTGRAATVPAITDGSVTGTGTASHWALTDGVGELLATGSLTASQAVSSGNTFTLDAIELIVRDAT
jgi:hypothetical protein